MIEISAIERVFFSLIPDLLGDHIGARAWNRFVARRIFLNIDLRICISRNAEAKLSSVGTIGIEVTLLFVGSRSWSLACKIRAEILLFLKKLDLSP